MGLGSRVALLSLCLGAAVACTTKAGPMADGDASFDLDSGLEFESGSDATTPDAGADVAEEPKAPDATFEAGPETGEEAAVDSAAQDATGVVTESGTEASAEASVEAGPETGAEPEPEAGLDAAPDVRPMCVNPVTDCAATSTLCQIPVCTAGVCAIQDAPLGTTCNDSGGDACDTFGFCVSSCTDGILDGTETDVDCGGAYCDAAEKTCADGKHCAAGTDCFDKVCTGGVCQAATCSDGAQNGGETGVDCGGPCAALAVPQTCPSGEGCYTATDCQSGECNSSDTCVQRPNGQQCWNGAQSCQSGFCAPVSNGLGSVCCDTACTGSCQYCGGGEPGLTNGTCGQVPAGPAPSGQCAANGTCGNDGNCTAAGTCEQYASTYNCGPTCTGTALTAAGSCEGDGGCGGVPSSCVPYACSTVVPACNTTCSTSAQCAPGHTCTAGACL
jgi:hypothetical protein